MADFQALLYDMVKHVITGGLEIDDAISFFDDLIISLVSDMSLLPFHGDNATYFKLSIRI